LVNGVFHGKSFRRANGVDIDYTFNFAISLPVALSRGKFWSILNLFCARTAALPLNFNSRKA